MVCQKSSKESAEELVNVAQALFDLIFDSVIKYYRASLVAETVKRLPAMQETRVRSLGGEDPLETAMATHSSLLAWRIPRDREDLLEKEMATHSSILVW